MSTTKALTDLEWVKLAASKDEARPVLTGVYVNGRLAATDGHRLHFTPAVPAGFAPGIYHAKTWAAIEGTYPNLDAVIPEHRPSLSVDDLEGMTAILQAAIAANKASGSMSYLVTLPTMNGVFAAFNPAYLLDILKGAATGRSYAPDSAIALTVPDPLKPMRVTIAGAVVGTREAVQMPVRQASDTYAPSARFDLSEFVSAV